MDHDIKILVDKLTEIEDLFRKRIVQAEVDIQMLKMVSGSLAEAAGVDEEEFCELLKNAANGVRHNEAEMVVVDSREVKAQVDAALKKAAGGLH